MAQASSRSSTEVRGVFLLTTTLKSIGGGITHT
jgi:hypothetical protein